MISLETPSVTAKAYPGVNVVSWKPVTGANGYNVTVYEEGTFKRNADSGNSFTDTDLVNGKTYTYYVEAKSTTNPGTFTRDVYATNSRGEASVTAIVPPAGTKSLELPAYENGYDGTNTKTVPENDNWVVKPSNITVAVADGKVSVNFPMKAYLQYKVQYYNNDLPHEINAATKTPVVSDLNANNALGKTSFEITGAGSYQIAVVANARNSYYADSDEVIYGELVKIEKLELGSDTGDAKANYIYNDIKIANNAAVNGASNEVRVSFTPATKDGENVPTSWYKVYRRVDGEYTNTLVAAVKEDAEKETYYVDDKVPDVKKEYVYTIVVSDSGKYGKAVKVDLARPKETMITGITIDYDGQEDPDKKQSTWRITSFGVAYNSATTLTAYYWVEPTNWYTEVLADDIIAKGKTVTLEVVKDTENRQRVATTAVTGKVWLLVKAERPSYTTTYFMHSENIDYGD